MIQNEGRIKKLIDEILIRATGNNKGSLEQYLNGRWTNVESIEYIKIDGTYNNFRIITEKEKVITEFKLGQLHGCCGVCVSFNVIVNQTFRKKGINIIGNKLRQEMARICGYTVILCTDVEGNIGEEKTLLKTGWQKLYSFTNARTNNRVNISVKHL